MKRILVITILAVCLLAGACHAQSRDQQEIDQFIGKMETKHGFDRAALDNLFQNMRVSKSVLDAISKPAEKMPWYRYRKIFLNSDRVKQGVKFWKKHEEVLQKAEKIFSVPQEIMVAIIGIETQYGRNTGNYRVIDSLGTLAFHYPKRSDFFLSELEQYLLLTREQHIDPLAIKGSYAGAMGIPQFISSSYRRYAVDFDDDGVTDIWENPVDAIGSVGNYFSKHGWRKGGIIALRARFDGDRYKELITEGLQPDIAYGVLHGFQVAVDENLPSDEKLKLIEFDVEDGNELWLGLHNFYVITRYNHSPLYAMAVFQLAGMIREKYATSSARQER